MLGPGDIDSYKIKSVVSRLKRVVHTDTKVHSFSFVVIETCCNSGYPEFYGNTKKGFCKSA